MRGGELAIEVRTDDKLQEIWLKQGDFTQTISSEFIRAALSRAVRLYECNVHAIHAIRPYDNTSDAFVYSHAHSPDSYPATCLHTHAHALKHRRQLTVSSSSLTSYLMI